MSSPIKWAPCIRRHEWELISFWIKIFRTALKKMIYIRECSYPKARLWVSTTWDPVTLLIFVPDLQIIANMWCEFKISTWLFLSYPFMQGHVTRWNFISQRVRIHPGTLHGENYTRSSSSYGPSKFHIWFWTAVRIIWKCRELHANSSSIFRRCPGADLVDSSSWLLIATMIATLEISKLTDETGSAVDPVVVFDNMFFRWGDPLLVNVLPEYSNTPKYRTPKQFHFNVKYNSSRLNLVAA